MQIYILNATLLGKVALEILCQEIEIAGVITLKNCIGLKKTGEYFDYYNFCVEQGIEYVGVNTYDFSCQEDINSVSKLNIDLLIVASWQRLLPEWLISRCRIGVIGTHGSPEGITKGRGRSPQNWALILGKREFYISIFWIDIGIDNGNIIDTRCFNIEVTDDILSSYIKVNALVADMIIKNIENGQIEKKAGIPQTEAGTYLPQRIKNDGKIDWNRSCYDIYNMVRALTKPYPGAYTELNGEEFSIWSVLPIDIACAYKERENGEVVSILNKNVLVKCQEGLILIKECSNIKKIEKGMIFESAKYSEQIEAIIERHEKRYSLPIADMILKEKGKV